MTRLIQHSIAPLRQSTTVLLYWGDEPFEVNPKWLQTGLSEYTENQYDVAKRKDRPYEYEECINHVIISNLAQCLTRWSASTIISHVCRVS